MFRHVQGDRGPSHAVDCRLEEEEDGPSMDTDFPGSCRQDIHCVDQEPINGTAARGSGIKRGAAEADGKLGESGWGAECTDQEDHRQLRDAAVPARAATANFPESSTSVASDVGSLTRNPRGVEAMMGGGQRRTQSGALTSPSGLSDHSNMLVERASSISSTHRALLSVGSPDKSASALPVVTSAMLELAEMGGSSSNTPLDIPCNAATTVLSGSSSAAVPASAQGEDGSRRAAGIPRPTLVIPSPFAANCQSPLRQPMQSPRSGTAQHFSAGFVPVEALDLNVIDDVPSVDACGLSSSSSPTISGPGPVRSISGAHLRSSRDHHDLRRTALLNTQLLSPSVQQTHNPLAISNTVDISVSVEGALPAMFTGATRSRALHGSNSSLQSGAEQYGHSATESSETASLLQLLRLSRTSTPSPAAYSSPARPRSATTGLASTPRTTAAGGSRGSSATGSPVPPPSYGPAAALLAGNVYASPRSPLSAALSPRPSSTRSVSGQGTPLPGPLFGCGFNSAAVVAAASDCTTPGHSHSATPGNGSSSCSSGSYAVAAAAAATESSRSASLPLGTAADMRRNTSVRSPALAAVDGSPAHHPGDVLHPQPTSHMQQLLRQQVMQHDTRFGPHGESPLSPSHHQQLPAPESLISPSCPTSLVSPALNAASSHNRQLADATAATAPASAGTVSAARPAGSVGQLHIHEWLDHHSWRLPYEVPPGLRDAADVREATSHEHTVSRMAPSRGASSRNSSQRNSLTNLDSPGGLAFQGPAQPTSSLYRAMPPQQQQQHGPGLMLPQRGQQPCSHPQHQQATPDAHLRHEEPERGGDPGHVRCATWQVCERTPMGSDDAAHLPCLHSRHADARCTVTAPDTAPCVGTTGMQQEHCLSIRASGPAGFPPRDQSLADSTRHALEPCVPWPTPSHQPSASTCPQQTTAAAVQQWCQADAVQQVHHGGHGHHHVEGTWLHTLTGAQSLCRVGLQASSTACAQAHAAGSSPAALGGAEAPQHFAGGHHGMADDCGRPASSRVHHMHAPQLGSGCSNTQGCGFHRCVQLPDGSGVPCRSPGGGYHHPGQVEQLLHDPICQHASSHHTVQCPTPPLPPQQQAAEGRAAASVRGCPTAATSNLQSPWPPSAPQATTQVAAAPRHLVADVPCVHRVLQDDTSQRVLPGVAALFQKSSQELPGSTASSVSSSAHLEVRSTHLDLACAEGPAVAASESACLTERECAHACSCCEVGLPGYGQLEGRLASTATVDQPCHSSSSSSGESSLAALLADCSFVHAVLAELPGVDPGSDVVWAAVRELQTALSARVSSTAAEPQD